MEPATAARLRHLNDSAHLLIYAAPSTAAFLQSRYNKLLEEDDVPIPDTRARQVCGACGFNMLWNPMYAPVKLVPENKKRKKLGDTADEAKKIVSSCQMCHSKTHFNVPISKRTRTRGKPALPSQTAAAGMPSASTMNPSGRPSPETGSNSLRKRSKGRKQQSLQAMLAKSKAEAAAKKPGFGLDLMDLMKGA